MRSPKRERMLPGSAEVLPAIVDRKKHLPPHAHLNAVPVAQDPDLYTEKTEALQNCEGVLERFR